VGLVETDLGLQYAEREAIRASFVTDFSRLSGILLDPYRSRAEAREDLRSWNQFGVRAAMLQNLAVARDAFRRASRLDDRNIDPLVNLGSVEFLDESYERAYSVFLDASERMGSMRRVRSSTRLTVFLNLAKTAYRLENFEAAERYYEQAAAIDPEAVSGYAYIGTATSSGGTRASDASSGPPIFFADSPD
jgi:tetratricopeptide (TPR) repeat protein